MAETVKRSRAQVIAIAAGWCCVLCPAGMWFALPDGKSTASDGTIFSVALWLGWPLLILAFLPGVQARLLKRKWPTWIAYVAVPVLTWFAGGGILYLVYVLKLAYRDSMY
ncbi:MAG: hypothetical protein ACKVS8_14545 [Phycisphaerales bacterium]